MPRLFWLILGLYYAMAPFALASVLQRRRDATAMLAWVVSILFLPFIGIPLYILLGENRIKRKAVRRRRRLLHHLGFDENWAQQRIEKGERAPGTYLPQDLAAVEEIGRRVGHMPATSGNEVAIYQEANATYAALEEAIRAANHHVHLEYYIWQPDQTGEHFRDLLIAKSMSGVECRLLLDAVGCWKLGRRFLKPLSDAGVRVAFFLPLFKLRRRWSPHLRNHRKLVVVDGRVAFMGSQNIGDEYRGRLKRLSPWYDCHTRIRGPAVPFLQQIFAEDWAFATREPLDLDACFVEPDRPGGSIVQVLATGPDQEVSALSQIVFAAVSSAQSSIRIAVPYFVPDPAMLMALQFAAYRGVRVQIVLPTRTDSLLALWAGRSFYGELLRAGVEIWEYDSGVLHSKIVTIDERWCLLSSANMDIRSFRLNFEITSMIYDEKVAGELAASIERYCRRSRLVTLREAFKRPLRQELIEGAARLFAPLL